MIKFQPEATYPISLKLTEYLNYTRRATIKNLQHMATTQSVSFANYLCLKIT